MKTYTGKRWVVTMRRGAKARRMVEAVRFLLRDYAREISVPVVVDRQISFEVVFAGEVSPVIWLQVLCAHLIERVTLAPEPRKTRRGVRS